MPCSDPRCSAAHDDGDLATWLAREDARAEAVIERHGWMVQAVLGHGSCPDLAYTVGLWGMYHPEVVVFGLPHDTAHPLLNELAERVRAGTRLHAGDLLTFEPRWGHRVRLVAVPQPERVLFQATRTYGRPVPALQAVWDDMSGRFPWDAGYDLPGRLQPLPGTPAWRA